MLITTWGDLDDVDDFERLALIELIVHSRLRGELRGLQMLLMVHMLLNLGLTVHTIARYRSRSIEPLWRVKVVSSAIWLNISIMDDHGRFSYLKDGGAVFTD